MAGGIDVYQLCPCGSGRKLKFCCHAIVTDMVKVSELQESHQHQAALSLLDQVEKKIQPRDQWSRAWARTTRAFLKFALNDVTGARECVTEVLGEMPEHPLAVAVNAIVAVAADRYPAAMRAIYRAYQFSAETQPFLVSHLALAVAQQLEEKESYLGAAQHFMLALRFAGDNEEAVSEYREFVGDRQLPYPFRDMYALRMVPADDPAREGFGSAVALAGQGRYSDAAKAFGMLARQDPKRVVFWWNIALCHAWAGEDPLAVEAFKAAAAHDSHFESSVNCLLLARLLKAPAAGSKVPRLVAGYTVAAPSRLLSTLDQQGRFLRVQMDPQDRDSWGPVPPVGVYRLIDRDRPQATADVAVGQMPHVIGELLVFDRTENQPEGRAALIAFGTERLSPSQELLLAAAADLLQSEGEPREQGYLRREHLPLLPDLALPEGASVRQSNEMRAAFRRHIVDDVWPVTPQETLGGKSPREAAQLPELKPALAAAVLELETFCEANHLPYDPAVLRERLGLPEIACEAPANLGGDAGPLDVSLLALRHTDLTQMPDPDLSLAADRAMILGHGLLSCRLLQELIARPSLAGKFDLVQACMFLSRHYLQHQETAAALEWSKRGKEAAVAAKQPMTETVLWEIHELMIRSQIPGDAELPAVAARLWNFYLPKLPQIRGLIMGVVEELQIPGPWNNVVQPITGGEPLAAAGVGASGLWTPGTEAANPAEPSKLWLPGQE